MATFQCVFVQEKRKVFFKQILIVVQDTSEKYFLKAHVTLVTSNTSDFYKIFLFYYIKIYYTAI